MRVVIRIVTGLLVVAMCASCSLGRDDDECESVEEYQAAVGASEITVPSGLDRPDPGTKLNVPPSQVTGEALAKQAACMQRPPSYFDKPIHPTGN